MLLLCICVSRPEDVFFFYFDSGPGEGAIFCCAVISYLRPVQFVATEKPLATSSLAIPMPISPIDRMPTVASFAEAIVGMLSWWFSSDLLKTTRLI